MGGSRILLRLLRRLVLSRFAGKALPLALHYRLLHQIKRRRRTAAIEVHERASDLQRIEVQKGAELWVCWSDVPNVGRGPSASLVVLQEEVFRFDCFGGREGHMHLNPEQHWFDGQTTARLFFPEGSRAEQVDRAVFELVANTDAALQFNFVNGVRNFAIDQEALAEASVRMRHLLLERLNRHGVEDLAVRATVA